MRRSFFVAVVLVLSRPAVAEEPPSVRYVVPQSGALRSGPGGELYGNLRRGIAVTPLETRGDWTHVQVDAWMRRTDLAAHEPTAQSAALSSQMQVTGFSIQRVAKDKKEDRAKLELTMLVQNNTDTPIAGWSAIVVFEDREGKPVLRTPIEGGPIAARAVQDFHFYYDETESQYAPLSGFSGNGASLTVNLFAAKIR